MPTVHRVHGFRFFFFSNEGDEPPHIHVERAECAAKYWLQPDIELAWSVRFRSRHLKWILRWLELNQERVLEKWNEHFED
jgi:hypothetical protein